MQLFEPKVNAYTAIVQIFNRIQEKGETVQNFALDLSSKADFFEFENTKDRDNILKYRFISGLVDDALKWELYKKDIKEWTFAAAVKAAEILETTKNDFKGKTSHSNQVNRLQNKRNPSNKKRWENKNKRKFDNKKENSKKKEDMICYTCSGKGHGSWECPSKNNKDGMKIILLKLFLSINNYLKHFLLSLILN